MDIEKVLNALNQMKVSCSATQLEELGYAIDVLEKIKKAGVKDPLNADFTKLNK